MDRQLLKEQLERHEGLRLKPYRDTVGKLTIGYGRNLDDVGIAPEEAELMLDNDIDAALKELRTIDVFNELDEVRQAVITNMCFNLGFYGLMSFSKMWKAIQRKDYREAAVQMLNSLWARQVGSRSDELAKLMRDGGQ